MSEEYKVVIDRHINGNPSHIIDLRKLVYAMANEKMNEQDKKIIDFLEPHFKKHGWVREKELQELKGKIEEYHNYLINSVFVDCYSVNHMETRTKEKFTEIFGDGK